MTDDAPDFASAPPADGFDGNSAYQTEVERLAALPPHAYDRERKAAAKELGVRVPTLDADVKRARPRDDADDGQGKPIELPEIELHPDPVDGAELIRDLVAQIRRFIVLPEEVALTVALWTIFAHAHDAAFHSPRLAVLSPVHRCGKSTLLRIIGMLVVRKVAASSVTASATFRMISAAGGLIVLLIDEFDQLGDAEKAGELVAIVNAGHCRLDAYVIRTVPVAGDLKARRFECWAPAVVASNKALPVTWMDRSIVLRMKRKARGDQVDRLRDDKDLGFDDLASRAARWAADHVDQLRGCDPALPAVLNDRAMDNWRMLVAVADLAGGDWGARARAAAVGLATAEDDGFAGAGRAAALRPPRVLHRDRGRPGAELGDRDAPEQSRGPAVARVPPGSAALAEPARELAPAVRDHVGHDQDQAHPAVHRRHGQGVQA